MSKSHHKDYGSLLPPRKHVFLLSCMDSRLLDDTVAFMNSLNLENRYDQVVFAGAALGVMRLTSPSQDGGAGSVWRDVFFHHLQVAIDVLGRKIKNVYILEHRDCGAYEHFHPKHDGLYCEDEEGQEMEEKHHREQAFALGEAVHVFCEERRRSAILEERAAAHEDDKVNSRARQEAWSDIRVDCFLMDLRGAVKHLGQVSCDGKKSAKSSKKKKDH
jgi:carbonic anhydrase